jgi:hypothetical protein
VALPVADRVPAVGTRRDLAAVLVVPVKVVMPAVPAVASVPAAVLVAVLAVVLVAPEVPVQVDAPVGNVDHRAEQGVGVVVVTKTSCNRSS